MGPWACVIVPFEEHYYNSTKMLYALKQSNKEAAKRLWKAGDSLHIYRFEATLKMIIPYDYITLEDWITMHECVIEWINKYTRMKSEVCCIIESYTDYVLQLCEKAINTNFSYQIFRDGCLRS